MNLTDKAYEDLLTLLTPFAVGELEEIVDFETKSNEERSDIIKVCMKTLEVSVVLYSKLLKEESLVVDSLKELTSLVREDKLEEAAAILNSK